MNPIDRAILKAPMISWAFMTAAFFFIIQGMRIYIELKIHCIPGGVEFSLILSLIFAIFSGVVVFYGCLRNQRNRENYD